MNPKPSKAQKTAIAASVAVTPLKATLNLDEMHDSALLRESQLVPKRKGMPAILPVSGPTLWRMVKAGEFPTPIKLTDRITCWRAGQVREWLNERSMA